MLYSCTSYTHRCLRASFRRLLFSSLLLIIMVANDKRIHTGLCVYPMPFRCSTDYIYSSPELALSIRSVRVCLCRYVFLCLSVHTTMPFVLYILICISPLTAKVIRLENSESRMRF